MSCSGCYPRQGLDWLFPEVSPVLFPSTPVIPQGKSVGEALSASPTQTTSSDTRLLTIQKAVEEFRQTQETPSGKRCTHSLQ